LLALVFFSIYVSIFLSDFNNCSIDKIAIIEIMTKSPNEFLIACKKLSDTDFYGIKLKLSDLPENIKTDMAIKSLNSSDIKTNRKRKLIHKLKKKRGLTKNIRHFADGAKNEDVSNKQ
jgi:hypothetical protein